MTDPVDIYAGATLRRLRLSRSMGQAQLGEALGVTFQQVQKYERGFNRLSVSTLFRAAVALKVSPLLFFPPADGVEQAVEQVTLSAILAETPYIADLAKLDRPQRDAVGNIVRVMCEHSAHG